MENACWAIHCLLAFIFVPSVLSIVFVAIRDAIKFKVSFKECLIGSNCILTSILALRPAISVILLMIFGFNSVMCNDNVRFLVSNGDINYVPEGVYCYTAKVNNGYKTFFIPAEIYVSDYMSLQALYFQSGYVLQTDYEFEPNDEFEVETDEGHTFRVTILNRPSYHEKVKETTPKHSTFSDVFSIASLFCVFVELYIIFLSMKDKHFETIDLT